MPTPLPSRAATERDADAIVETLVQAFAGDPVWGGWAFPDRERAAEHRRAFFDFWTRGALRYDGVRVTAGCEAVAIWYPPGQAEYTAEDERRLDEMARALLGGHAGVFLRACAILEETHPYGTPHWYLSMLGTRDDARGRGLGMALLREGLARADAAGLPAYLESTNLANNRRYERLGFVKMGAFALPAGGPTVDQMWREPGGGGGAAPK